MKLNTHTITRSLLFILVASGLSSFLFSQMRLSAAEYTVDDSSYVSHAFTIALDFDLDYSNEPMDPIVIGPSGNVPKNPIGPGMLAAPFVFIFSVIDRFVGAPVIEDHNRFQYTWSHFGIWVSASVYFLWAVLLYFYALRRLFSIVKFWHVLLFSSAIGLLYYTGYRPTWGHAYEFFGLAVTFYGSVMLFHRAQEGRKIVFYAFIAACGVVSTLAVRPANINVLVFPVFIMLVRHLINMDVRSSWNSDVLKVFWYVVFSVSLYCVLGLVYQNLYGTFFPTPADMYGVTPSVDGSGSRIPEISGVDSAINVIQKIVSLSPNILKIVFSSEFGLLYFGPILVIGTIAVFCFLGVTKSRISLRVVTIIIAAFYVAMPITVVLIWQTTASAYGYRYLFSLFPIAILGYYLFLGVWNKKQGRLRKVGLQCLQSAVIILSVFGVFAQLFFNTGPGLNLSSTTNVFGVNHCCSGIGYLGNVTRRMVDPKGWYVMYTHRAPSVFVGKTLDKTQSITGWEMPAMIDHYTGAIRYLVESSRKYPNVLLLQLSILAVLWGAAVWWGAGRCWEMESDGLYD